jgi:hypothetical protein
MRTTFLDYYKMILDKVSFNPNLLTKEYQKAVRTLKADEVGDLNSWLMSRGIQSFSSDPAKRQTYSDRDLLGRTSN